MTHGDRQSCAPTASQPATLLVVALGTFVQRCAQADLDHVLRLEVLERRVQALEALDILEHRLDQLVNHVGIDLGSGGQHGLAADGLRRLVVATVQAAGNLSLGVVALLFQQLVDFRAGDGHQHCIDGGSGLLDSAVGMTDEVGHGVDIVVAQGAGLLGRLQLGCKGEDRLVPALFLHDFFERIALTGARVTDVDTLALEIIKAFDVGVATRQHGEDFALQGEDRADVIHLPFLVEGYGAFHRLVLVVRLHDAEIELAAAQAIDVRNTSTAGRSVALEVLSVAIDEAADRLTGNVVHTGLSASADGDETFLRLSRTAQASPRQRGGKYPCQGFAFHGFTPFLVVLDFVHHYSLAEPCEPSREVPSLAGHRHFTTYAITSGSQVLPGT